MPIQAPLRNVPVLKGGTDLFSPHHLQWFQKLVDEFDVTANITVVHTATDADDHAVEIDVDAAGFGDVKAIDIDYITGAISAGEDEGVILVNIDETLATGGEVFALEVLATDGSATIHGLKVGPLIAPIHQDSGTFINPTTATDNTADTDVDAMKDGSTGTTTAIFEADDEYIIIGNAAAFQDMELILTTGAGKNIKPTFWYSIAGTGQFSQFTPVDGTDGCKHTGVISWDASDLTSHVADTGTGTFDIKIIRTRNNVGTTPILGYAKTAATTEYVWDKDGNVSINKLITTGVVHAKAGIQPNSNAVTASETLDDYEEGEDTAVVKWGANIATLATSGDTIYWTKVGNYVTVHGRINTTAGTATGNFTIDLPFTSATSAAGDPNAVGSAILESMGGGGLTNVGGVMCKILEGATVVEFFGQTATSFFQVTGAMTTNAFIITFTITYRAA